MHVRGRCGELQAPLRVQSHGFLGHLTLSTLQFRAHASSPRLGFKTLRAHSFRKKELQQQIDLCSKHDRIWRFKHFRRECGELKELQKEAKRAPRIMWKCL